MRGLLNRLFLMILLLCSFLVVIPLFSIVYELFHQGLQDFSFRLLWDLPGQLGEKGGFVHAIVGTVVMLFLAGTVAIPAGLLTALFMTDTKSSSFRWGIELCVDLLNGAPSIIIGIFVYFLLVLPLKMYSALAGACALSIIILPIVIKTSYEILKLVPSTTRQAGLALGLKRWHVGFYIVIWGSRRELMPGILNALARASGETAPLLFTAFGSPFIIRSLMEPTAALPIQIYQFASSPYPEWNRMGWNASMLLVSMIFTLQLTSRILMRTKK